MRRLAIGGADCICDFLKFKSAEAIPRIESFSRFHGTQFDEMELLVEAKCNF